MHESTVCSVHESTVLGKPAAAEVHKNAALHLLSNVGVAWPYSC